MSNCYDEKYEIRLAQKEDIDNIMMFIENDWKHGHIMATNRELFEYEFLEKDGNVNFVLAIDKSRGTIEGLNGFIKSSQDKEHLDIWGSIWKVREGNMGMLGAELIKRRKELIGCRCDLDVGDNPKTAIPVLKVLLKRYTCKMHHYYILAQISDFKIAKVEKFPERKEVLKAYSVVKFDNIVQLAERFDCVKYVNTTPYKDYWYIDHRFFNHPIYRYEIYGVEIDGAVEALAVFRKQKYDDRIAIRFVDYIGNRSLISGMGVFLRRLLVETDGAEYIDFYCAGINEEDVLEAGFTEVTEGDENIIPNYFGPFLQENIDIWVDSRDKNSLFTKADADQDRPNTV